MFEELDDIINGFDEQSCILVRTLGKTAVVASLYDLTDRLENWRISYGRVQHDGNNKGGCARPNRKKNSKM